MDEKRMPFLNLKTVNAKNMQFKKTAKIWHIYSLRFLSLAGTQRYKRDSEKDQGNKIKDSGGAYDIN